MGTLSTIGALGGMSFNSGSIYGTLHLIDQPFFESLSRANKAVAITAMEMEKHFVSTNRTLQTVQQNLLAIGGISAVAIGASIFKFAEYEKRLRNVNTILKVGDGALHSYSNQLKDMSKELGSFNPTELTNGLYDIASSGFEGANALGVLKVSAKSAMAGVSNVGTASKAITGILQAYGTTLKKNVDITAEAEKVSDLLFQTVNLGILSYEDLTQGIGQVTAAAASARIPLEDVGALIATVTRAGFMPAEALVRVQRFITAITTKPSPEMMEFFKVLGVKSGVEAIDKFGIVGFVEQLNKRIDTSDPANLQKLFPDEREIQGVLSLVRDGVQQLKNMQTGMHEATGATTAAFKEQEKSISHSIDVIKQNFNVAALNIGEKYAPAVKNASGDLVAFTEKLDDFDGKLLMQVATFALVSAGVLKFTQLVLGATQGIKNFFAAGIDRFYSGALKQEGTVFTQRQRGGDGLTKDMETRLSAEAILHKRNQAIAELEISKAKLAQLATDEADLRIEMQQTKQADTQIGKEIAQNKALMQRISLQEQSLINDSKKRKVSDRTSGLTIKEINMLREYNKLDYETLQLQNANLQIAKESIDIRRAEIPEEQKITQEKVKSINATRDQAAAVLALTDNKFRAIEVQYQQNKANMEQYASILKADDATKSLSGAMRTQIELLHQNAIASHTTLENQRNLHTSTLRLTDVTTKFGNSFKGMMNFLGLGWANIGAMIGMTLLGVAINKVIDYINRANIKFEALKKSLEDENTALEKSVKNKKELATAVQTLLNEYTNLEEKQNKTQQQYDRMQQIAQTLKGATNDLTGAFQTQNNQLLINIGTIQNYIMNLKNTTKEQLQIALNNAKISAMDANKAVDDLATKYRLKTIDERLHDMAVKRATEIHNKQTQILGYDRNNLQEIINAQYNKLKTNPPPLSKWDVNAQQTGTSLKTFKQEPIVKLSERDILAFDAAAQAANYANQLLKIVADTLKNTYTGTFGPFNDNRDYNPNNPFTKKSKEVVTPFDPTPDKKTGTPDTPEQIASAYIDKMMEAGKTKIERGLIGEGFSILADLEDTLEKREKDKKAYHSIEFDTIIGKGLIDVKKALDTQIIENMKIPTVLDYIKTETKKTENTLLELDGDEYIQDRTNILEELQAKNIKWLETLNRHLARVGAIDKESQVYKDVLTLRDDLTTSNINVGNTIKENLKKYADLMKQLYEDLFKSSLEEYNLGPKDVKSLKNLLPILQMLQNRYPTADNQETIDKLVPDYIKDIAENPKTAYDVKVKQLRDVENNFNGADISKAYDEILNKELEILSVQYKSGEYYSGIINRLAEISKFDTQTIEQKVKIAEIIEKIAVEEAAKYQKQYESGTLSKAELDTYNAQLDAIKDVVKLNATAIDSSEVLLKLNEMSGKGSIEYIKKLKDLNEQAVLSNETYKDILEVMYNSLSPTDTLKETGALLLAFLKDLNNKIQQIDISRIKAIEDTIDQNVKLRTEYEKTQKEYDDLFYTDDQLKARRLRDINQQIEELAKERSNYLPGTDEYYATSIKLLQLQIEKIQLTKDSKDKLGNIFTDILWDSQRDSKVFQNYFKDLFNTLNEKTFKTFMNTLLQDVFAGLFKKRYGKDSTVPSLGGMNIGSILDVVGLGKLNTFYKNNKTKIDGGLLTASSIMNFANMQTTNPMEGAIGGLTSGIGVTAGMGQMFGLSSAALGPIGIALGIGGALLGFNKARENAEKIAERQREEQLKALKNIYNGLKPVSDYFNRGGFGALTNNQAFAGGIVNDWMRGVRM